jgi:hypothetical protein
MTERPQLASIRHLNVVLSAAELPESRADTRVIVLDPGWVAVDGGRPDLLSARSILGQVVESTDVPEEALRRIDAWAADTALPERLAVEDTTYWFRVRETMWRWLHERLLWLYAFERIDLDIASLTVHVPADEDAIADVAAAFGAMVVREPVPPDTEVTGPGRPASRRAAWRLRPWLGSLRRRLRAATVVSPSAPATVDRPTERFDARDAALAERVGRLATGPGRRIIVLTTPATFQRVGALADVPRDPNLGAVIERLPGAGYRAVLMGMGLDAHRDADWQLIERDEAMLPFSLLRSRWSGPADTDRASVCISRVEAALADVPATDALAFDGIDLGAAAASHLRSTAIHLVRNDVRQRARVERLLAELRPEAIVLTQEGIRLPWLTAARAAGIPTFALQHGVLYRGHAGYPNERHPRLVLADRTFVYGDFERRVLVDELAYEPSEVEVTGSPRLDLDDAARSASDLEREAMRSRLGVAVADRMLVVSTIHLPFYQRSHLAHALERLLGSAMPRVHVVFKQHPGERDEGFYRQLLQGLAAAGRYHAPPISVVRDVDLYALLRAADAHLGLHSTVLTDAVAAGAPNLIAVVDAHADLIGYVEAGVARPVADAAAVVAALDSPPLPETEQRAAFLADHLRPGDASGRIIASIERELRSRATSSSVPAC